MTDHAGALMKIGELGERTGLSHRTLRHYDEIGLLQPSGRSDGNFRLYTEADYERLMLIRRMKPLGYTLEEMGGLLDAVSRLRSAEPATVEAARDELHQRTAEATERREKLARQVEMAEEFLDLLGRV